MKQSEHFAVRLSYGNPRAGSGVQIVHDDDFEVTRENVTLSAYNVTLCLALSMIERQEGICSLANVMWDGSTKIPGDRAVDILLDQILALKGSTENIEAYLAGQVQSQGLRNLELITGRLDDLGIPILGEDTGGNSPRRVFLYSPKGDIEVYRLS